MRNLHLRMIQFSMSRAILIYSNMERISLTIFTQCTNEREWQLQVINTILNFIEP